MKIFICLFVFLFTCRSSFAQQAAKIVFFRHDFVIVRNGLIGTGKKLYCNGAEIKKIRKKSIFVYESTGLAGSYYMNPSKRRKLQLAPKPNSISFVQLRLYPGLLTLQSSIKEVSFNQFKKYYEQEAWLRAELDANGYHSLEELIKGYNLVQ